ASASSCSCTLRNCFCRLRRASSLPPGVVALLRGQPGRQIFQRRDEQGDRRQQQHDDRGSDPALVAEEELQEGPINRTDRTHCSPTNTVTRPRKIRLMIGRSCPKPQLTTAFCSRAHSGTAIIPARYPRQVAP